MQFSLGSNFSSTALEATARSSQLDEPAGLPRYLLQYSSVKSKSRNPEAFTNKS
jgi:hypothetical protein